MSERTQADEAAWGDFWARNARGGAAEGSGCLPARWAAIEDAQKAKWLEFAQPLRKTARLLDLATGDARVLRWIIGRRSDLKLTGTDLAPTLPPPPRGTKVRAGVAMENLPFPDARFDAVTSQFGFEYGDIPATAKEIRRVLATGGRVGLMVHRGDGPILEHNLARQKQIAWVLDDVGLIAKAKAALTMGPGPQAALDFATATVMQGAQTYGKGSAGWEIPEAVRRTLLMGARSGTASMIATLDAIAEQARNEMGRIASLERACAAADAREALVAAMAEANLELSSTQCVEEPGGRKFADFLTFS